VIRRLVACLLALSFTALAVAADDPRPEPPDPLVKKKRPDADNSAPKDKEAPKKDGNPKKDTEPKKDAEKKDGDPKDEPAPPAEDDKAILERINKNMKESGDRLKKNDPGDATRQVQKDIVADLDSLINQAQQQAQQNQPQGSGGSSSKNPKDQQASKSSSRSKRNSSRTSDRRPNERPSDSSKTQYGEGGAGKMSGEGVNKLADSFKDIWGHLPETLRLEMDAYAKEQFMAKYNDLLKQYYSTIAERKRRGEEEK
jgi:hypothetical protein